MMRRLDNVRAEFSLTARVDNPRRALNIFGVETIPHCRMRIGIQSK